MEYFTPPELIPTSSNKKIFLAGTIEMGNSDDWQSEAIKHFRNEPVQIFNPRRQNWNPDWKQSFESSEFFQQVTWEMDAMDKANIIVMNFLPNSKSPISLLELGLYANSKKILVCCPDEFWRSGNVQIVCNKYNIPLFKTLNELLTKIKL
jgi:hypothetical protein